MQNDNLATFVVLFSEAMELANAKGERINNAADWAAAATAVNDGGNTIWFDASGHISQGTVLWAIPQAGWVKTFHRGDRLVVVPCRQDGSPISMASLNEVEVGFHRPTLDQHWGVLRPCLVPR
jgi:hypothetical protein